MASGVTRQFLTELLSGSHDIDGTGDTVKVALFDNTGTPSVDDSSADAKYQGTAGAWVSGAEESDATAWPTGGIDETTNISITQVAGGIVEFDFGASTGNGGTGTLATVYYALVYDDTDANKRAISWHDLSGPQGVSSGTFSVVWNATTGVFRLDA